MSTEKPTLQSRLRKRREDLGATISQAADWMGLDSGRLHEIESGAGLSAWELEAVSRGLAIDSRALKQGIENSPRRSVARFRAMAPDVLNPEDLRTLSLAAEIGLIGGYLAEKSGRASQLADLRNPLPIQENEEVWKQGYGLGEIARRALPIQAGPIRDLEQLLVDLGVHIARVELSSPSLDAASLWESDALPTILLNSKSPRVQSVLSRRALLAHELCHLLHDSGENDLTRPLTSAEGSGSYHAEIEQRARAFAPAFLAPRPDIRHWFSLGGGSTIGDAEARVESIAKRWGFSQRGAVWHAKNCGVIRSSTAVKLDQAYTVDSHPWSVDFETSARGFEAASSQSLRCRNDIAPIARGLLATIVEASATAGFISEGRACEILTWA